ILRFFFSSRRRHTSCLSDWSSDVCSSDLSSSLDNALELLVRSGRDPVHALMMLLPEAWERAGDMPPPLRGFYEYHAGLMEPWDEIGRASCRERVEVGGGDGSLEEQQSILQ